MCFWKVHFTDSRSVWGRYNSRLQGQGTVSRRSHSLMLRPVGRQTTSVVSGGLFLHLRRIPAEEAGVLGSTWGRIHPGGLFRGWWSQPTLYGDVWQLVALSTCLPVTPTTTRRWQGRWWPYRQARLNRTVTKCWHVNWAWLSSVLLGPLSGSPTTGPWLKVDDTSRVVLREYFRLFPGSGVIILYTLWFLKLWGFTGAREPKKITSSTYVSHSNNSLNIEGRLTTLRPQSGAAL